MVLNLEKKQYLKLVPQKNRAVLAEYCKSDEHLLGMLQSPEWLRYLRKHWMKNPAVLRILIFGQRHAPLSYDILLHFCLFYNINPLKAFLDQSEKRPISPPHTLFFWKNNVTKITVLVLKIKIPLEHKTCSAKVAVTYLNPWWRSLFHEWWGSRIFLYLKVSTALISSICLVMYKCYNSCPLLNFTLWMDKEADFGCPWL